MPLILAICCVAALGLITYISVKRKRDRQEMEQHCIVPEDLHTLLTSTQEVLLYDVRQPLDLLADPEIIPGATRIAPKEIIENPSLIPKEKDAVVYCTCPSDETSKSIARQAAALGFLKVKFLRGGLGAWKAKGYPVVPYEKPFHLDTGT